MLYMTQTASGSPSVEASMAATCPWVICGMTERSGVSKGSLFWLLMGLGPRWFGTGRR